MFTLFYNPWSRQRHFRGGSFNAVLFLNRFVNMHVSVAVLEAIVNS